MLSFKRSTYGVKVNHLPHNITEEQVSFHFERYGSIASVFVKDGDNECYAFVNFYSDSCAQTAAREMNGAVVDGKHINCRVQPQGGRSSSIGEYAVKVTGLPKHTTSDTLSELFSFGDSDVIQSVRVNTCPSELFNYAYVNYFSRHDAVKAVNRLDKSLVDGSQIRVHMHPSTPQHHSPEPNYRSLIPAQSVPRSAETLPNVQAHASSYGRRHSATPQYMLPPIHHHHPTMQRHFSQPSLPASTPTQHIRGTQTSTVKVSIYGNLSPDDLEEVFSQFGEIRERPIVRHGEPKYCYINFSSPEAATSSLCLSKTTVMGVRVEVKVSMKQRSIVHQESKEIPCASLVASILWINHRDELERLKKEHQVSLKPSPNCIKMWGQTEQIKAVEECLQLLIKRLKEAIVVEKCELPCHSVPLFEQESTIKEVKKIEASQGVEFCILKSSLHTLFALESFCKEVKECFTPPKPTQVRNSDAIPMRSDLASFLKVKALKSSSPEAEPTWLWENDSGTGFESYTPTVSSQLSQDYTANPTGSTLLQIGKYVYKIDFSQMTQTNTTSNRSRNIMKAASSTVCVQWFYRDDMKVYVPYTAEQSAEIEQMFQSKTSRNLDIKGNTYTFDFSAMTQCNVVSRNSRKIERRLKVSQEKCIPIEECVITLQVSGLPDSLDPAIEELESMVAKATIEKECQLYEDSSDEFQVRLIKNMTKYFVTAELVGKSLKLKGMPRYVERVALLAEQEKISDREQRLQEGGEVECQLPTSWDPQPSNLLLAGVKRSSEEWNNEVSNIRKTLPGATIVKLERIQNKWLWERYSFAKKRMSKTNKDHVNEKHLFHGTRTTPPEKVFNSEKGLDFRFSNAGLWGTGSYFAVNASYSDAYAYQTMHGVNVIKQMFICKVLTGESYVAEAKDNSLRQPPLKPVTSQGSFAEERYDSVKGYTNGSYVYVVYDHEKVYPAYLVTYSHR